MNKTLTVIIPSYNNIEYLKLCYNSIRRANTEVKLIIIDDGSSDGTSEYIKYISSVDTNLISFSSEKRKGHTYWYDFAFNKVITDYIGIIHSDMVVPQNFFDILFPYLKESDVVSAKCIEPPLHPPGVEKIVKDFGMYPDIFQYENFHAFVENESVQQKEKVLPSLFAPWFIHKKNYHKLIGSHDKQFIPYGWEDADLFVRMMKVGFNPVQIQSLLVYHFTQRGHRWNAGKVGTAHTDYQLQMTLTRNRFLSKWGTLDWKDEHHTPKKIPLYYRQLNIKNYRYGNNQYEYINMFFNKVIADDNILYNDGRNLPVNYEVIFDYNLSYDHSELQSFFQDLPFMVENLDEGDYELGGIIIRVHNKQELPMRLHYDV